MRVAVTGASGYIGRHVVDTLIEKGHEVIAVDIRNDGINEKAIYVNEDIFSGSTEVFKNLKEPDACIHMAWRDGFVHNSKAHMQYLSSHFEFLTNLVDAGCKKISVMGTMHEVGFWEGKIDENTPCNPLSQYGVAKNALRQAMLGYMNGKDAKLCWLRAYYILGDDMKNHSIFTKILQAANEGKKTFPFTSGTTKYDFIDVNELAHQIVAATVQDKYDGIINVCTGDPRTLGEVVEKFIADKNLDIELEYGAYPDRAYDSKIIYGDNTIIQNIMMHE